MTVPGARAIRLDITDQTSVEAAVETVGDVDLLVNNAGILTGISLLQGAFEDIEREMQTNFYGPLRMIRAVRPQLAARHGAVLDILSVLSWVNLAHQGAYCAAKAAAWSMTNAARQELARDNVLVCAVHVGLIDTDMIRGTAGPKTSPQDVERMAVQGLLDDQTEVVVDDWTRRVQRELSGGVPILYPVRLG